MTCFCDPAILSLPDILLHKGPIISLQKRGTAGAIVSFAITVELWNCESTGSLIDHYYFTVGAIASISITTGLWECRTAEALISFMGAWVQYS